MFEQFYRTLYWRHNELELIQCDFDSLTLREELERLERGMTWLVQSLGYMPAA